MKLLVPPPVQGLIAGGAMWGIAKLVPALSFATQESRYFAIFLIAVGFVIEVIAVGAFFRARTTVNPLDPTKTKALVVKGLYRFSRNPMYLGLLLLLTGVAFWFSNPLNILILFVFVWSITTFQIKPEEEVLFNKFGVDYQEYYQRVRRWL